MDKPAKISLAIARRMAINAQLLDGRTKLRKGKEGVAQTIEKLGYIQIDTISVIERAHHHTLWTRRPDYNPAMLDRLLAKDRRVFEYWGHAASYLPMSDYRYYLPKMKSFYSPRQPWYKNWADKYGHLVKETIERIRQEGPLASKDFALPAHAGRGPWWDWKPYKVALELLFWRGELMITARHNFSRLYDLTERVLPEGIDTRLPTNEELGCFLVHRALASQGVAQENEIQDHLPAADKKTISKALRDLVESGEVTRLEIENGLSKNYYALTAKIEVSAGLRKTKPRLWLLSPFDNLITHRGRLDRLFGFDYSLECYTPPSKRVYGYFVLPILWGEDFVGRLDPKADRKTKTLIVRKLTLENGLDKTGELLPPLAQKLWDLARFNDCEKITLEKTVPAKIKKDAQRQINQTAPME